eukprot:757269-Hanusia_phi.AAC.8
MQPLTKVDFEQFYGHCPCDLPVPSPRNTPFYSTLVSSDSQLQDRANEVGSAQPPGGYFAQMTRALGFKKCYSDSFTGSFNDSAKNFSSSQRNEPHGLWQSKQIRAGENRYDDKQGEWQGQGFGGG